MKLNHIAAAAFGALAAFSVSAETTDSGWVKFTGTVTASACTINASAKNQEVALGTIPAGRLRNDETSTPVEFTIALESCSYGTVAKLTVSDANKGDTPAADLKLANGTNMAEGVAVRVLAQRDGSDYTAIDFTNDSSKTFQLNSGTSDGAYVAAKFQAQMVASDKDALKAGDVLAQMNYTVEYK